MKNSFVISASAAAVIFSAPAMAEEFNGPFAGVQAGYESTEATNPATDLGTLAYDDSRGSFTGGFFMGYDKKIAPRWVIGAEAGMDFSTDGELTGTIGGVSATIEPQWSLDLTARAGYMLDSKSLLYVRGGYEAARIETSALSPISGTLSKKETRDGWTVGAGYERYLLDNVSTRLEYRYSDLSDGDDTWDRHRVLAGVSYRF